MLLAGCAQEQKVGTFAETDLQNAIAIDQANLPAEQEKLMCDQWILQNLTAIQNAINTAPQVTGIFSLTSQADVAAQNVLNSMSSQSQQQFEMSCGPLDMHILGLIAGFKALKIVAPVAAAVVK